MLGARIMISFFADIPATRITSLDDHGEIRGNHATVMVARSSKEAAGSNRVRCVVAVVRAPCGREPVADCSSTPFPAGCVAFVGLRIACARQPKSSPNRAQTPAASHTVLVQAVCE